MLSEEKYAYPQMKPLTGVEENRHFLRVFIHTYRELPVLWDTSLRDYTNREKRGEAYERLVPIYRYLKRDATVEDVKKKINTLRTNYRKELKVVECARRSGMPHQPRCWTFHELDFLRNTEKFLAVNPSNKLDAHMFNENTQTQTSIADQSPYSFRSIIGSNSTQTNTSITEFFQKSFSHSHFAQQSSAHLPTHVDSHPHSSQSEIPAVKRQRLSPPATNISTATSTATIQNPDELLNIACDYLSNTFPEEESIARTWTHKLKRMQRDQRLLAEKFINEILFEGETGTLHRTSVHFTNFEPYDRFEEDGIQIKSQSPSVHTSTTSEVPKSLNSPAPSENATPSLGNDNNFSGYT